MWDGDDDVNTKRLFLISKGWQEDPSTTAIICIALIKFLLLNFFFLN